MTTTQARDELARQAQRRLKAEIRIAEPRTILMMLERKNLCKSKTVCYDLIMEV